MSRIRKISTKSFTPDQEKIDYWNKVVPELIAAEQTVARIKSSPEWKRADNYFNVLHNRGHLAVKPTKANGYKVEFNEGIDYVALNDIKDMLTEEQLCKIKMAIKY